MDSTSQFSTDDERHGDPAGSPEEPTAVTSLPPASTTTIDDATIERKRRQSELRALGKTHGDIPGVPIFTTWDNRNDCMNAAVHRSILAGICGNKDQGVSSIVLSGSYEDDEDGGETIIYTGCGGRKQWTDTTPPKRLRLGPQIRDQSWEHPRNRALLKSLEIGNPIRVIRSSKRLSKYAPASGYRYDGLYQIISHWTTQGKSGFIICRCKLERLPGQPPIPIRPVTVSATKRGRKRNSDLISSHQGPGFSSPSSAITTSKPFKGHVRDDPQSGVEPGPPRRRRRTDQAGHAIGYTASNPSREIVGAPGLSQQPAIPESPAPLAVEAIDIGIPLQSSNGHQAVQLLPENPDSSLNELNTNTNRLAAVPRPVSGEPVASGAH